uniref:DUF616 domain-containing protein n=1 Tax=viral metagenome TaxID=1070528 RepID=A0A6C0ETL1_9ZZZZ
MEPTITIVTACFDVNFGDGQWIQKMLQLNCNLYVVTEEKHKDFILQNRPQQYPIEIKVIDFKDSYYYKYYDRIKETIESDYYKNKIENPTRIECTSPEYNILQYSKYKYMNMAAESNPFQSIMFFWLGASSSEYLDNMVLSAQFPSKIGINRVKSQKKIFFTQNNNLYKYNIDGDFVWKSEKLLYNRICGGDSEVLQIIAEKMENIFVEDMLNNNNVNDESVALVLLWNKNQYNKLLFALCEHPTHDMFLMKILS